MQRILPLKLTLAALLLAAPAAYAQQVEIQMNQPSPRIRIDDTARRQEELRRVDEQRRLDAAREADHARLREMENEKWQRERQQAIRDGYGVPHGPDGRPLPQLDRGSPGREVTNNDRAFQERQRALDEQQRALNDRQRALEDQRRALQDQRAASGSRR